MWHGDSALMYSCFVGRKGPGVYMSCRFPLVSRLICLLLTVAVYILNMCLLLGMCMYEVMSAGSVSSLLSENEVRNVLIVGFLSLKGGEIV